MTSHSNVEQEEPIISLPASPATDSEVDVEEDLYASMTDEEAWQKYLSTKYEHSSKKPMKDPLTAHWGLLISDADLERLKVGVKSRNMDDKCSVLNSTNSAYTEENPGILYAPLFLFAYTVRTVYCTEYTVRYGFYCIIPQYN